ncbi:META domain-containing protein [Candidatus Thiothrix anitrata]|jgi:heat shock protein HslJ|uniref:META domain-containing protein n=1 Tax=Candidatus Thiothrix anitrata TaxID=2823902 RepID=A0ABX7X4G8_9GAMM|nr:META domain-containing protein [Candidatus Thiothrix anitrata]QTR50749.1 META domain-containing protein [Candidatus Thiothrix anitrata]
MKKILFPLVVCFALLCNTAYAVDAKLNKTEWTLQSLSGWNAQSPAKLPQPATLAFSGDNVSGNDGCNLFNGIYTQTAKPNSLRIPTDKMMSTMMACMGGADKLSRMYLQALNRTTGYQLNNNILTLKDARGRKLATFNKPATTLPGTNWQVMDYHNGQQGIVSSINTERMRMTFSKDGGVTGNAGCNRFFGTYTHNPRNNSIAISQLGATKMFCQQPEDVMQEEALFLKALTSAKTYRRSGASLELSNAQGIHVVGLRLK